MIPKKIHYVWLSKNNMSDTVKKCMDSWKNVMPEYEIKLWNEDNFNIFENKLVRVAYENGFYSLASDYIRLYALYNEGGLYFDTDIEIIKPLDDSIFSNGFFGCIEISEFLVKHLKADRQLDKNGRLNHSKLRPFTRSISVMSAFMGGVRNNMFCRKALEAYDNASDILLENMLQAKIIAPQFYADVLYDFGFCYKDKKQTLTNNITIYPSDLCWWRHHDKKKKAKASLIHYASGTGWSENTGDNLVNYIRKWV